MSTFCEDDESIAKYPQGIFGKARHENSPLIRCLQWGDNVQGSERDVTFQSAKELTDTASKDRLRVVFMTNCTRETTPPDVREFKKLFKYYSVPSDVLTERMRSVNHAFGSSQAIESEAQISWCHFLCRQIEVYDGTIKRFDYLLDEKQNLSKSSNALNLWIMCDFFLHVTKDRSVTLLCFGVPPTIVLRFEKLLAKASWDDVLEEPFLLFVIILDELHDIFNSLSTILAVALRKVEEAAISQAGAPSLNFHQLHEIQKNVIFMIESAEAIISTHEAILESLNEPDTPKPLGSKNLRESTVSAIKYRKRTFKSTLLKVYSLERRAMGSTQVYQSLLTQADAHAMKFIAVLTLVFLPVTGVSTIFSSPFFNVDFDEDSTPLRIAWCFWKFWAIAAPLTLGIGVLCFLWFSFPALFSFSQTREIWTQYLERRKERREQGQSGV